jgi:molecular chaperone DnaK
MVYQGERQMAKDNKMLGHFKLEGIKAGRRGEPRIEVTFSIDVNGIVKVSAKDLDSQKEQQITISGTTGLSKEEIERMIQEAEANKEADDKRREEVELKNKAEQFINTINQTLEEKGDKIDAKQKEETIKLKEELEQAIKDNDYEKLRAKIADLEKAAEFMAQQGAGQPDQPENQPSQEASNNEDVIDADFTEKK